MYLARSALFAVAFMTGMFIVTPCSAQAPATPSTAGLPAGVIARVNGVGITQSRLDFVVRQQVEAGGADSPELRKQLREALINREAVAQAAAARGYDRNPDLIHQFEIAKQDLLASALLGAELQKYAPSEDEVRKEYDTLVAALGKTEYKARHILLASEDEARKVIADLKQGASFEQLAGKSRDTSSAQNGGDLGWLGLERMAKPLADAITGLQKGQITLTPVQSQFGWHVIRLDDTRERVIAPFEQVKGQIVTQLRQRQSQRIISDIRAKAKVE